MALKAKKSTAKNSGSILEKNNVPDRVMGQVPQVKSDVENERQEARHVASRNEPSKRKTEAKKPSKK
jgi:hypothetical protein